LVAAQRHQLVIVMRRAHLHPAQGETIDALLGVAPNAIAVSALEPFDALRARTARTILCSFGDDELAFEAVADVLVGRFEATGTVPVSLERAPA
ncbi:MAG TPA: hypothetical protein VKG44_07640, partial [Candidatus Baltobacteraceae bacterium]|nr:hypothetical protein [Candidatus Baltobacteraceae bacterium]